MTTPPNWHPGLVALAERLGGEKRVREACGEVFGFPAEMVTNASEIVRIAEWIEANK